MCEAYNLPRQRRRENRGRAEHVDGTLEIDRTTVDAGGSNGRDVS